MYRGKFAFQNRLGQLVVGRKLPFLLCFTLYSRANSKYKSPPGAYIRSGDLTEGFLRYDFGGLIFEGTYTWRGFFSELYGTLSSGSSLVKARTCARDPVQQHFFSVPYGISTEAHAWHLGKEHTNLMNSGTPTITHFGEHSTRLYDCKS